MSITAGHISKFLNRGYRVNYIIKIQKIINRVKSMLLKTRTNLFIWPYDVEISTLLMNHTRNAKIRIKKKNNKSTANNVAN